MNLTRLQGWLGSQAWAARLPNAVARRQSPRGQQPVAGTTRLPEPPGPAKAWDAARRPANKRAVAPGGCSLLPARRPPCGPWEAWADSCIRKRGRHVLAPLIRIVSGLRRPGATNAVAAVRVGVECARRAKWPPDPCIGEA